jgi:3-oxoacyl-[acyl-carrier-protein] synthase III
VATIVEAVGVAVADRRRLVARPRGARKLADASARRALDRAGLAASDVDLLISTGLYHDRNLGEPALAALIQEDIGANPEDPHEGAHGTFSFDVANGSCGMLTGLQIADGFLRAGSCRHAVIVASDDDPGHRLAPGFPFAPAGGAVVCGWRPGAEGVVGFRGASRLDNEVDGERSDEGLRATVAFEHGRNLLTIDEAPEFAADAGAWAGDVASKLLVDHGLTARDIDAVVANPQVPEFLAALARSLGAAPDTLAVAPSARRAHTAGLAIALDTVAPAGQLRGRTVLLVSAGAGPTAGAALVRQ